MSKVMQYLTIVLLMVLSAFFSSSEMAYSSANGLRLRKQSENSKKKSARLAYENYNNYDSALTAILIGNNLVNIAASSIATVIVIDIFNGNESYAWVATLVMTIIVLIFGEIIPKIVAKAMADKTATLFAIPLKFFIVITKPILFLMTKLIALLSPLWEKGVTNTETVTEDDLENIIDIVEEEGVMDEDECDLLQSALDFGDVLAYEVITPRVDMLTIDIDDDITTILNTVQTSNYSRIPVYEDTIDNVIGIIHINQFYRKMLDNDHIDIRKMLMPVHFVHKTMPLFDVFEQMKKYQSHMVIVCDEYGGTMGLLTMEDVLEQIVGDIWDESDEIEPEFRQVDENKFIADGDMRLADFLDEFDLDEEQADTESATVGGWVIDRIEKLPENGDSFDYNNLHILITKTAERRVLEVQATVFPLFDEQEEE